MEHCIWKESSKALDVLVGDVVGQGGCMVPHRHEVAARQCRKSLVLGPRVDALLQERENFLLWREDLVAEGA